MPRPASTYEQEFLAVIAYKREKFGYRKNALFLKAIAMCECTWYRRLKKPDEFTAGELRRIFNLLQFTKEERDLVYHKGRMNLN